MNLSATDRFEMRHIGPRATERDEMLKTIGVPSLDALMDEALPASIRLREPLPLPEGDSEFEYLQRVGAIGASNRVMRSCIGMGYHDCVTPAVILRNVFENPGWYTPYTPYQAEIAQGRLEALLTFQTVVADLTGLPIANASLLDEATAATEAMAMLHRVHPARNAEAHVFLVSDTCFPQTIDVLKTRAEPLGIELRIGNVFEMPFRPGTFGVLVQTPDDHGALHDLRALTSRAHEAGVLVAVATDLLALTLVTPPGEMGADVVVGSAQRFGVPMGYGGPHAAFFATREQYVRQSPGRIIGMSIDAQGNRAYRMALQTREQHIRREKATSNICTAQALLATMAAMYAVYHGPNGLRALAQRVHNLAAVLARGITTLGFTQANRDYFDTIEVVGADARAVERDALAAGINFRYFPDGRIGISLNETIGLADVADILSVFASAAGKPARPLDANALSAEPAPEYPAPLRRTSDFLTHEVFHLHHSETAMMRYLKRLERKDVGLDQSMIPLGSCTMKLNAAVEMIPITSPAFARMHPFAPVDQARGYQQVFRELEQALCTITGLSAVSLQPNSGAQGEFTGLKVIRAWHKDRGEARRDVVLIPASAHGTNPASGVMAGLRVVVVACDARGNVDVADLEKKAAEHQDRLAALMITYPSTHGVFEDAIRDICRIVHEHGGQVYMDGANMNAQVGLTSPAAIGADVCHINLHKTFAIPHGGGGPGMGPIAVAAHLAPYLPGHPVVKIGGPKATHAVSAAPWGSALILLISYGYIRLLGAHGLTEVSRYAILNANYITARLKPYYPVLYTRANGRVAHEMIFDLRGFKAYGIEEGDVAKRLMDYGFHAPTVSFPVPGTLMIEPTESEPKQELDRFCDALIAIRGEIQDVVDGKVAAADSVLKHAPHTQFVAAADAWPHPYTRKQAAFPLSFVQENKIWPAVGRIDNPYGDRHLVSTLTPIETYAETR